MGMASNIAGRLAKPNYGIDAPRLVRGFLATALVLLAASGVCFALAADHRPWAVPVAWLLALPAVYALGMLGLMLWESLVTKVVGREAILNQVAWTGNEAVLDVGCGRGVMLVGAARRLTTGRAIGVDIWLERDQSSNTETAPIENARLESVGDRVSVQTADMRILPFAEKSFDVVISSWAVHNLDAEADRFKALSEMVRVLRPTGTILLTDITNREEYLRAMKQLCVGDLRLSVASALKDRFLKVVSFGAYAPATIVARQS